MVIVSTWAKRSCDMAEREALTTRISSRRNRSEARVSRCQPNDGEFARCAARLTCGVSGAAAPRGGVGPGGLALLAAVSFSAGLPGALRSSRASSERFDGLPSGELAGLGNIRCSMSATVLGGSASSALPLPAPAGFICALPLSRCGPPRPSSSSSSSLLLLAVRSFLSFPLSSLSVVSRLDPELRALVLALELPRDPLSELPRVLVSRELQGLSSPRRSTLSRPRYLPARAASAISAAAKPIISASPPARQPPPKNDESFPISRFRPTRQRP